MIPNWILLYTGSSINVFSNPRLTMNIHKSERTTKTNYNAGVVHVNHIGTLPGYRMVWFNRELTENILSMDNYRKNLLYSMTAKWEKGSYYRRRTSNSSSTGSRIACIFIMSELGKSSWWPPPLATVRYTPTVILRRPQKPRKGWPRWENPCLWTTLTWYIMVCFGIFLSLPRWSETLTKVLAWTLHPSKAIHQENL